MTQTNEEMALVIKEQQEEIIRLNENMNKLLFINETYVTRLENFQTAENLTWQPPLTNLRQKQLFIHYSTMNC
jgi:hypothetical protein